MFRVWLSLLALSIPIHAQTAITNVTIIDPKSGGVTSDETVLIQGNRIFAITPSAATNLPPNTRIIKGAGKYLIPGLWDMHVHSATDATTFLPAFIANGVTGVRSMFDDLPAINARRKEIAAGTVIGPRIFASGPIVDGPHPIWPGSIAVTTPDEGREAVRNLKSKGVDFIKVYSLLSRDAYLAIADEAQAQHITLAGHVPNAVTAAEASDSGQKSIEHLSQIVIACSTDEAKLMQEAASPAFDFAKYLQLPATAALTFDEARAHELFAKLANNQTWQVPTLTVLRVLSAGGDPKDPRLAYMPPSLTQSWSHGLPQWSEDARAAQARLFDLDLKIVGMMQHDHVRILAGTDTANPYVIPGLSLHEELQLLVRAGLTPLEALQSATSSPAEYLGIETGRIAPGRVADLVLLNANPLESISNTSSIEGVMVNGRYLDHENIATILMTLTKAAAPAKAPVPHIPADGLISDFEGPTPTSTFGSGWSISADTMAGGKSKTHLAVVDHALKIDGEILPGFANPWSGAFFSPGTAPLQPADISSRKTISFKARATANDRTYAVMLFSKARGLQPAIQTFTPSNEWQDFSFPIQAFDKLDGSDCIGIFIGATAPLGPFELFVDDVRLQ